MKAAIISLSSSKKEILYHIIFWLIHIGYRWGVIFPSQGEAITDLLILIVKISATYFTVYYLFFELLFKKKNYQFIAVALISLVTALLLRRAIIVFIVYPYELIPVPETTHFFYWADISRSIVHIYPVVILALAITMARIWYHEQINKYKLSKEKLESELKYLKAQIHPHFLFNTINNIYSSSLKKNDQTSDLLLKLSALMRYMIYESQERLILISKEIDILENYIELEKIRYGDQLKITFNYTGDIENKQIPPLLFLPFVENSFKHGAAESIEENWISIDLTINENLVTFKVENSKPADDVTISDLSKQNGIGLSNLEKRLSLLFKDQYDLKYMMKTEPFYLCSK